MDILSDILSKSESIPILSNITTESFKKECLNKQIPVNLKGMANDWEAKKKWSIDYFLKLENNKQVRLDIGNIFQGDSDAQKENFKTFLEKLKESKLNGSVVKTYLALFDIFEQLPELKNDTDFSVFTKYTKVNYVYGWIGPAGTVTGLHSDSVNNLLAQLEGKKIVLLAMPKYTKDIYVSKKFDLAAKVSSVDINNYDEGKHPKFKNIPFYSVVLEPGDVLFIPRGWWHYVKSLDFSISVNNFGYQLRDMLTAYPLENLLHRLHARGLYRKNNCTCHLMVDGKRISKY